ncbi:DUF423 domain-containing protein [Sphingopyxis sp. DBS4]|uniref:DUF423 domain-containing protein n=1 Tax=Sphingopyxis sp. DBS4 TaxID=2968500 RepID=UPI00214BD732|nr:DUF423 domain-containing protein [Sphingopyxis sp. DBS4]
MRAGTLLVLCAVLILLAAQKAALDVRQAAQIQFMHGMGIFACATFMNIGAEKAKYVPACFIAGIVLYCGPVYLAAASDFSPPPAVGVAGMLFLGIGWSILAIASGTIDQIDRKN